MNKTNLSLAFVGGAIAIAIFFIWRQLSGTPVNFRPSAAVGEVLAAETARLLPGVGKVVVVGRSAAKEGQTAASEQIASFSKAIGRLANPKISASEWLPPVPPGAMDSGGISAPQLAQVADAHPEANALVVFAGLPPFAPALAEKFSGRPIKLIVVCGYSPNMRRWLESRALALAVIPRLSDAPPETAAPKTPQAWFDREFELLRPESVPGLPY